MAHTLNRAKFDEIFDVLVKFYTDIKSYIGYDSIEILKDPYGCHNIYYMKHKLLLNYCKYNYRFHAMVEKLGNDVFLISSGDSDMGYIGVRISGNELSREIIESACLNNFINVLSDHLKKDSIIWKHINND